MIAAAPPSAAGPPIAHVICTLRRAATSPVQLLVLHTLERERPSLRERFARRHTPDLVIELCQN